jgi:hypothetical protein
MDARLWVGRRQPAGRAGSDLVRGARASATAYGEPAPGGAWAPAFARFSLEGDGLPAASAAAASAASAAAAAAVAAGLPIASFPAISSAGGRICGVADGTRGPDRGVRLAAASFTGLLKVLAPDPAPSGLTSLACVSRCWDSQSSSGPRPAAPSTGEAGRERGRSWVAGPGELAGGAASDAALARLPCCVPSSAAASPGAAEPPCEAAPPSAARSPCDSDGAVAPAGEFASPCVPPSVACVSASSCVSASACVSGCVSSAACPRPPRRLAALPPRCRAPRTALAVRDDRAEPSAAAELAGEEAGVAAGASAGAAGAAGASAPAGTGRAAGAAAGAAAEAGGGAAVGAEEEAGSDVERAGLDSCRGGQRPSVANRVRRGGPTIRWQAAFHRSVCCRQHADATDKSHDNTGPALLQ